MSDVLPNFFIVGAMKSGTTSLYQYLSSHPDVYLSPIKEPHYFCEEEEMRAFACDYDELVGFNMQNQMDSVWDGAMHQAYIRDWSQYLALFARANGQQAIGEASPGYLYAPSSPELISKRLPKAKIIIILREPIARAYSHYRMDKEIGRTQVGFWKALTVNGNRYIEMGRYEEQVKRYLANFPADQIKLLWFDDLKSNRDKLLTELADFLGIDPGGFSVEYIQHNQGRVPRSVALNFWIHNLGLKQAIRNWVPRTIVEWGKSWFYAASGGEPEAPAVAYLSRIYDTEVKKLATLTNRDLSAWSAVYKPYLSDS